MVIEFSLIWIFVLCQDTLVPEEENTPQNNSSVPSDTTAGSLNLSHVNDTEYVVVSYFY